jgi:acyl-coenzyme A synthetase/AMP-(fatty) acid ligase/acyl carrier protein
MSLFRPLESLLSRAASDPDGEIIFHGRWYSAAEVASLVRKAATFLMDQGFQRGAPVPLLFAPSLEAVILLYATQAIGAYAVPFSWQQPNERVLEGLRALGTEVRLVVGAGIAGFDDALRVSVEDFLSLEEAAVGERGEFYCQFHTSGTTGVPKAVRITQANVDYLLDALRPTFLGPNAETFLFSTTWIFDVSTIELLFWPFDESRLVIPAGDPVRMLKEVPSTVRALGVTHLNFSPSVFNNLSCNWSEEDWRALSVPLRRIFFAGEELKVEVAARTHSRLPALGIFNCYGPTECTVYATIHAWLGTEEKAVPIGTALPGARVELRPLPGVDANAPHAADVGEIVIEGEGVAPGYFRADPGASKRFFEKDGQWIYSTGDLARRLPSGELLFLGRMDRQVQVNGIRVELGEVESILDGALRSPGSTRVIHGENGLVAFYLGAEGLRASLKKAAEMSLPSFSRPSTFLALDEFPLSPNGKTDDRALKERALEHFASYHNKSASVPKVASFTELPDVLPTVLRLLDLDARAATIPLLELGLDSLAVLSAIVKLEDAFAITIPESTALGQATAESLAHHIRASLKASISNGDTYNAISRKRSFVPDSNAIMDAGLAQVRLYRCAAQALLTHAPTEEIPCHGYQRVYHFDSFESAIDVSLGFPDPQDEDRVLAAIAAIVEEVELLKVGATQSKRLVLRRCKVPFPRETPRIRLLGTRRENATVLARLSRGLSDIAKTCEPNGPLHAVLVVSFDDGVEVLWSLSHLIADAASAFVLKKLLTSAVKGLPFSSKPYSAFVRHVESRTDAAEIHAHPFTSELLALPRLPNSVGIVALDSVLKETLTFDEHVARDGLIARVAFEAARRVARNLSMDAFGVSTIVNLRETETYDARYIIGDCHGAVVMPYAVTMTFEMFEGRMRVELEKLKSGCSPQHAAFAGLPEASPTERDLEDAYDTVPVLGVNFLGFVARADVAAIEDDLSKFRKSLEAFPASRIYATAFQDETGAVHLYFLNGARSEGG